VSVSIGLMETNHLNSTPGTSLYINIFYIKCASHNNVQYIPNCGLSGRFLCISKNYALVKFNARLVAVINLRIVVSFEL
jgi:hypothetical protein